MKHYSQTERNAADRLLLVAACEEREQSQMGNVETSQVTVLIHCLYCGGFNGTYKWKTYQTVPFKYV